MKDGKIQMLGEPKRVVDAYLQDVVNQQEENFEERKVQAAAPAAEPSPAPGPEPAVEDEKREQRWGKREIEIRKVSLKTARGEEKHVFHPEEGMVIEMDIAALEPLKDFVFGIGIFNSQGISCYGTNTAIEDLEPVSISGEGQVACRIERLGLINGTYYLDVAVHKRDGYPYDYHRNLYSFLVSSTLRDVGVARLTHAWTFSPKIKFKELGKEKRGQIG
jgi:ABC-2 type transport system ATP-binding protein/lipopolysaccharide transport system ATP-binding protein